MKENNTSTSTRRIQQTATDLLTHTVSTERTPHPAFAHEPEMRKLSRDLAREAKKIISETDLFESCPNTPMPEHFDDFEDELSPTLGSEGLFSFIPADESPEPFASATTPLSHNKKYFHSACLTDIQKSRLRELLMRSGSRRLTHAEIVERSGVTRNQISRFAAKNNLKRRRSNITKDGINQIAYLHSVKGLSNKEITEKTGYSKYQIGGALKKFRAASRGNTEG